MTANEMETRLIVATGQGRKATNFGMGVTLTGMGGETILRIQRVNGGQVDSSAARPMILHLENVNGGSRLGD